MNCLTLAIDTSSRISYVALANGTQILATKAGEELGSAEVLTSLITDICASSNRRIDEISQLAVCLGPGSFTGLRTGIATAYGLSFATGIPIIGVSALVSRAYPQLKDGGCFVTTLRASRAEIFWSSFITKKDGESWQVKMLSSAVASADEELETAITTTGGINGQRAVRISVEPNSLPEIANPAVCAALAAQFMSGSQPEFQSTASASGLDPIYVKGANAKTLMERNIGRNVDLYPKIG